MIIEIDPTQTWLICRHSIPSFLWVNILSFVSMNTNELDGIRPSSGRGAHQNNNWVWVISGSAILSQIDAFPLICQYHSGKISILIGLKAVTIYQNFIGKSRLLGR